MHVGPILAADAFYTDRPDLYDALADYGVLAVEMESAALYTIAARFKARALTLLTVSDHIKTGEKTSAAGTRADLRRDGRDRPGHRHRLTRPQPDRPAAARWRGGASIPRHKNKHDRSAYFRYAAGVTLDGRVARGERTRTAVLDAAVVLATTAGLHGLSLAQLADTLGVSKSGLFAHWRSKEALQLATVDRAVQQWQERVIAPALRAPRGVRRLWALHDAGSTSTPPGCCPAAASSPPPSSSTTPDQARSATGWPRRSPAGWRSSSGSSQEAVDLGELPADPASSTRVRDRGARGHRRDAVRLLDSGHPYRTPAGA